jgi:heptaprenylglyceryl phosphate synthase
LLNVVRREKHKHMTIYQTLLQSVEKKGAAYLVLVDPDKVDGESFSEFIHQSAEAGVDGILVGGSLVLTDTF